MGNRTWFPLISLSLLLTSNQRNWMFQLSSTLYQAGSLLFMSDERLGSVRTLRYRPETSGYYLPNQIYLYLEEKGISFLLYSESANLLFF